MRLGIAPLVAVIRCVLAAAGSPERSSSDTDEEPLVGRIGSTSPHRAPTPSTAVAEGVTAVGPPNGLSPFVPYDRCRSPLTRFGTYCTHRTGRSAYVHWTCQLVRVGRRGGLSYEGDLYRYTGICFLQNTCRSQFPSVPGRWRPSQTRPEPRVICDPVTRKVGGQPGNRNAAGPRKTRGKHGGYGWVKDRSSSAAAATSPSAGVGTSHVSTGA